MSGQFVVDMDLSNKLFDRLSLLEERKDEMLVRITFLRELLDSEEEALKLVLIEEDQIGKELAKLENDGAVAA